ncbi:MAG: iron oxidase [Solirubrobacteraceae bacterium]
MTDDTKLGSSRSRRSVLQAGAGLVAGAAIVGTAGAAEAADPPKLAKKVVMYQDHPKNGQHCSICVHFVPPNACKIVAGDISPNGWCGVFSPKPA